MDEKLKVSHRVELENLGSQFRQGMYQTTITIDNLGIIAKRKSVFSNATNTNFNAIDPGPRIPSRT
ncbi:hypothetical protein N7504_003135 [Penicillium tannophilum]|nr:hypothetical protein N7504_003135 [Penicillium tannophilum]